MNAILPLIIQQLSHALQTAIDASERAHQAATDKENIPDNQYDTLALEAAYLAHGQSMRIQTLQASLLDYKHAQFPSFDAQSVIGLGALVSLIDDDDATFKYFMGPSSGGLSIQYQDENVRILTPNAPLGKLLIGKRIDDEVVFNFQGSVTYYSIQAIQ